MPTVRHRRRGGTRWTPAARRTGERPRPGSPSGRSRQDCVDDGLPCGSELAWQDEVGPCVDEESTVDEAEEVRGGAFTQHDLVAAGTSAAIDEPEYGARCRPVQTEWQRHLGKGFSEREPPEPVSDEGRSSMPNRDFGERDLRFGGQLEASGGEETRCGSERGRLPAALVRRDRRARRAGACGELLLAQSGVVPDTFEKMRSHAARVSDRIRHRASSIARQGMTSCVRLILLAQSIKSSRAPSGGGSRRRALGGCPRRFPGCRA